MCADVIVIDGHGTATRTCCKQITHIPDLGKQIAQSTAYMSCVVLTIFRLIIVQWYENLRYYRVLFIGDNWK